MADVFVHEAGLVNHQRNHTGKKPFKGDICGRKFSLKIHMKKETFKCETCGREFSQKNAYTMHQRTHKKPFIECESLHIRHI